MVFFAADDGIHGVQLWKSEGTKQGATMVRDIHREDERADVSQLAAVGGTLPFAAVYGSHGQGLWSSQATASNAFLVDDMNPGKGNHSPTLRTEVDDKLFFSATDGKHGMELWVLQFQELKHKIHLPLLVRKNL